MLDSLVEQSLRANTDLRVASANLRRARALRRETRSDRLPSTTTSAGASYGRASAAAAGSDEPLPNSQFYDAGLDVGYQVDLFGRLRRATEAGRADVGAAEAALDLARITVAAETTRAYADACNAGAQLAVAERSARLQQQTFDLTRRQVEGGRGTRFETGQAGLLLEQTRSAIPIFEGERRAALYRLAVLTGRPPAAFPAPVASCASPLLLGTPIPVGDGASLLRRRPDVREAERNLAAATARIGVATAELYPDIRIGLSLGSSADSLGGLVSGAGPRFSLGPLLSWSFPNRRVARARIEQANAASAAALARFDGTWLNALRETETSLARYASRQQQVAALQRARASGAEAARIARLRYQAGRESFQIVLDAERSLAQSETLLSDAQAQLSTELITLFLALGGGWEGQATAPLPA
jgi:NodT family efflux transporter outer membrane factor (OMF) lipoprotein